MTEGIDLDRHFDVFWSRYEAGEWESSTKALIQQILRPDDLFVDIGAWIGPTSLWALECGAEVIAIEPDPMALPELRRRVPTSVEIWEGAVGVRSGVAGLTGTGERGRLFGTSMSRLADEGDVQVRTWTLPEILGDRVPALVKIDIEGYEIDLLPEVAPYLSSAGVPMQVALHGVLPKPEWFAGYGDVQFPTNPHGTLVARP